MNWTVFIVGLVSMILFDAVYLTLTIPHYKEALGPMLRGRMDPQHQIAAFMTWPVMVFAITQLVLPRARSGAEAFRLGAILGGGIYAVYNFTNFAVLGRYPGWMAALDLVWGTALVASVSRIMYDVSS